MLKFLGGILLGALLAFGYVRFNLELPAALQLPERLRGNLVSSATEGDLYDLRLDAGPRQRALEIYFANRATDAARIDGEAGHPFLTTLYLVRARREARQLAMMWGEADQLLAKPALRQALEQKHGTTQTETLKRALLWEGLERRTFLKSWLELNTGPLSAENLHDRLKTVADETQRGFPSPGHGSPSVESLQGNRN
jgi:hypothetical protein